MMILMDAVRWHNLSENRRAANPVATASAYYAATAAMIAYKGFT